jgi:Na+/H+ antiporter NhaD/arsenite permease-like protein
MRSVLSRLISRERALFVGALFLGFICTALGVPLELVLFGLTLAAVGMFHRHALQAALSGLFFITLYKLFFGAFKTGRGPEGLGVHLLHEWVVLANLFALLLGFALLSKFFERSRIPAALPRVLPDDWKGGFALLAAIFVLSSFLDNIAAALIGGSVAGIVFRGRVHTGYLVAIVAASNAGGSWSVVGDTTTTMMWIDGVDPLDVLEAFVAAGVALVLFGVPASFQQHKHSPIASDAARDVEIDWPCAAIVALILAAAIAANVTINVKFGQLSDQFPFIGMAVWVAIMIASFWRVPEWSVLREAFKGSVFLLSLVLCASMMPVEKLPVASWQTALGLGFVSAVFDNIPLTALALTQGGYDWGFLAYAVGFGGSMIWFGSSAGVALCNVYPQGRSIGLWLKHGWHVVVAYVIGFFVMLTVQGWHPNAPHKSQSSIPWNDAHALLTQSALDRAAD